MLLFFCWIDLIKRSSLPYIELLDEVLKTVFIHELLKIGNYFVERFDPVALLPRQCIIWTILYLMLDLHRISLNSLRIHWFSLHRHPNSSDTIYASLIRQSGFLLIACRNLRLHLSFLRDKWGHLLNLDPLLWPLLGPILYHLGPLPRSILNLFLASLGTKTREVLGLPGVESLHPNAGGGVRPRGESRSLRHMANGGPRVLDGHW